MRNLLVKSVRLLVVKVVRRLLVRILSTSSVRVNLGVRGLSVQSFGVDFDIDTGRPRRKSSRYAPLVPIRFVRSVPRRALFMPMALARLSSIRLRK